MKRFVLSVFVFALFFVLPTRADDILAREKDAEPTVYASDVFVYSTLKDNEGNISRISYVSWNAKDKSIQYDSVADYKDKTYSLVEANRDKKKEILQMLLEKGVCGEVRHGPNEVTTLGCLMFDYSLPGYIVFGKGLPDDTYVSLIESSGVVHLIPFNVAESLVHHGEGDITVKLKSGDVYRGAWERRQNGSTGLPWTFKLQGLNEEGKLCEFRSSDISSLKFLSPGKSGKMTAIVPDEHAVPSERIKKAVRELGYPERTGGDLVKMVSAWRDAQGGRVLVAWQTRLTEARKNDTSGNIAEAQFVEVEANIVNELGQRIRKEISFHEGLFELADIIKTKQAQCLGYSQLVYILGYSLNLPVRVIDVLELHSSEPLPSRFSHVACLVNLADGRSIMVDLVPGGFISRPFTLEEEFAKVGNYWELKDESNPLKIHRRIQIRDRNGLIAHVHDNRGNVYTDSGQFDKALSEYAKAIELNPTYAEAYNNRGGVYADLGQFDRAISERTRAIELDPKFDRAYYNRGLAWYKSGQVAKAVSDYTVALGINPRLVEAYNNRGVAFGSLGQLDRAVLDFTKAVKVDPAHTEAYKNRGLAYFKLNQFTMAISDYTKALELDPELAEVYKNRGTAYGRLGRFDKAILDYSKAIDLDPKYAGAYYYRGLAQAFMENQDKAKQDLLKAVELDPSLKKPVKKISDNFKLNLPLD